jgi:hypothetical protein
VTTPDIGATIHKIPPIGWVVAVGVGIFFYMRAKNAPAPAAPIDLSNGTGTGVTGGSFIPVAPPTAPGGPTDIESWGVAALAYLIGKGYNPFDASQAIRHFIDGQNISSAEKTMIDQAIIGVPLPSGVSIPVGGTVISQPAPVVALPPQAVNRRVQFIPADRHLDWAVSYYGVPEATIRQMNPNLNSLLALANRNGYISATNPNKGDAVPVFGANSWIWLPA